MVAPRRALRWGISVASILALMLAAERLLIPRTDISRPHHRPSLHQPRGGEGDISPRLHLFGKHNDYGRIRRAVSHGTCEPQLVTLRTYTGGKGLWRGDGGELAATAGSSDAPLCERTFKLVPLCGDSDTERTGRRWFVLQVHSSDPAVHGRVLTMATHTSTIEGLSGTRGDAVNVQSYRVMLGPREHSLFGIAQHTQDASKHWMFIPHHEAYRQAQFGVDPGTELGFLVNRRHMRVVSLRRGDFIDQSPPPGSLDGITRHRLAYMRSDALWYMGLVDGDAFQSCVDDIEERRRVEEERRRKIDAFITSRMPQLVGEMHCVISYGLYGADPKYTKGALRNVELQPRYFPGWKVRFYVDSTVPPSILHDLKRAGAEVINMDAKGIEGSIAGMFWRFLPADDPAVDRFIVRDTDSRLNARDAMAVMEWMRSHKEVHSVRDHPNHARPLNGGLWGGEKGFLERSGNSMASLIRDYPDKDAYGADLGFLNQVIWPLVQDNVISHDAYTCRTFPHSRSFPTQRTIDYQHVGQVFDANDRPRHSDVDNFIRGLEVEDGCRRKPEFRFG